MAFGFRFLVAVGLFAASSPVHANLIVNGSFETPGCTGNCMLGPGSTFITGWTTTHTGVEYFKPSAGGGFAPDGVMAVDLANFTSSAGGIEQTFATIAGTAYAVSFSAGNVKHTGRDGTGVIEVDVAGQHFSFSTPVATSSTFVWSTINFAFTATAAFTTLGFSNLQNALEHFAAIDAVSVNAASAAAPGALALLGLGMLSLGVTRRRRLS